MLKFGIIAEGKTDQTVIENLLLGYFEEHADEPDVRYVQPPPSSEAPGGWGNVFKCLQGKRHEEALQVCSHIIIHIDTDVQEEPGFDVPRREGGQELSVTDRVTRVIDKIKSLMDPAFQKVNKHRILFAVAVDSIECWLLPLHDSRNAGKITGCLNAANRALRKANKNALSAGENKFIRAYEEASRDFLKRKTVIKHRKKNPSLELFITQLDTLPPIPDPL